jgi:hypothetical protein
MGSSSSGISLDKIRNRLHIPLTWLFYLVSDRVKRGHRTWIQILGWNSVGLPGRETSRVDSESQTGLGFAFTGGVLQYVYLPLQDGLLWWLTCFCNYCYQGLRSCAAEWKKTERHGMWTEHTSQMLLRLSDQRKCHWTTSHWVATRQSSKNCWELSSPLHRWEWQLVPGEHNPQNYSRLHSPGTYLTLWFLVYKIFVTCRDALCTMFSRLASDIPLNFRDFWSTSETKIASVTKIRQGYGQWVWIAHRAYVIIADCLLYLWLVFWSCSSNSHHFYGFQKW